MPERSSRGKPPSDQVAIEAPQTNARFSEHILRLKREHRLPAGVSVVVEPPFLVLGDESPESVQRWASHTVKWAVDRLKRQFFERDPPDVLEVWLFQDNNSYQRYNRLLFGTEPTTPFGYYSKRDRALVMNIATGGGTLVHEIVHPYIEENFSECPAWFNEGLGSLYEQSAERDGRIVGLTNWRLAGLQQAIAMQRLPTFQELTSTSNEAFYGADPGTNYAQARYLLYYLQERDLLEPYYRTFTANVAVDPTGYRTLVRVLAERDMLAFQARWERYVLGLSFP